MRIRAVLMVLCAMLAVFSAAPAFSQDTFAAPAATVVFGAAPSTTTINVGDTFTVTFSVQTSGQPVDAAELHLNFDARKLGVTSITAGTRLGVPILSLTYNNTTGRIDFAAGTFNNFPTQPFDFLTVTFVSYAATDSGPTFISIANEDVPRKSSITYAGNSVMNPSQPLDLAAITINDPSVQPLPSIVDIVLAATQANPAEFTTLLEAVLAADPSVFAALADSTNDITVFAPTNAAFAALLSELGITKEQLLADSALLTDVLEYHVLEERYNSAALTAIAGSGSPSLITLNGQSLTFSIQSGALFVNESQIVTPDIAASNGIVHIINKVLIPAPAVEPTATPEPETPIPVTETPVVPTETPIVVTETPLPATETPIPATETPISPTEPPPPPAEIRVTANTPVSDVEVGQAVMVEIWLTQPPTSSGLYAIDALCYAEQPGILAGTALLTGALFGPDPVIINSGFANEQARFAAAQSGANPPVVSSGLLFTLAFNAIGAGETRILCDVSAVDSAEQEISLPYDFRTIRAFINEPTATPTPVVTDEPTATPVIPEPTPTNTPEPTPTNTPEPTPTNTPEPIPTNTPEPTPTNTPEPGLGVITGIALRSAGPDGGILISIALQGGTAAPVSVATNDDGSFRFEDLPEGTYDITAATPGYLGAVGTVQVIAGQVANAGAALLLAGELAPIPTGDNVIDELDVVQLVAWYGQVTDDTNRAGDLNLDGRIGLRDLRALALNLRKTGPVLFG